MYWKEIIKYVCPKCHIEYDEGETKCYNCNIELKKPEATNTNEQINALIMKYNNAFRLDREEIAKDLKELRDNYLATDGAKRESQNENPSA